MPLTACITHAIHDGHPLARFTHDGNRPIARVPLVAIEAAHTAAIGLLESAVVHDLLGALGDESVVVKLVGRGVLAVGCSISAWFPMCTGGMSEGLQVERVHTLLHQ